MSVHQHIEDILTAYENIYGETESVKEFREFIGQYDNATSRKNLAGHLTGSALVWHRPSNTVLCVHHAKLDCWVFSAGGHIDDGELPWQAAVRELFEETGITARPLFDKQLPIPLIIDVQAIPFSARKSEPAHKHYDVVYLFEVDQIPQMRADPSEIADFKWIDVAEITSARWPVDLQEQMLKYELQNLNSAAAMI